MRTTNPLREILEAAMSRAEPMLDTEWPAGEVVLALETPPPSPRAEPGFLRPAFRSR